MKKLTILFTTLMLSIGLWGAAIDNVTYFDAKGLPQTVNGVTEINNSSSPVTWKTGWYVVNGDITLSAGAVCNGAVNIILADGAKLTARGGNQVAGIEVSGKGNSLAIYGQTRHSGQLIAIGGVAAAGIGGSLMHDGSNITINGGTVTATGGINGAGIGGGLYGDCYNITINGGTVTATGGENSDGIGGGTASNIKMATDLIVKVDDINPPTMQITNTGADLAAGLQGRYVTIVDNRLLRDGTKGKPYLIYTYQDLLWFSQQIRDGDQGLCARLEADIDATGKTDWLPIGRQGKSYAGTFNGNGHVIYNLNIKGDNKAENIGLFGKIGYTTEVYGLGIVNGYFEGSVHVGAICGNFSNGSIHDCYVYNTVVKCSSTAGGELVGWCFNVSELRDCYVYLKSDYNKDFCGVICGDVEGIITNCYYVSDSDKDSCVYLNNKNEASIVNVTRVSVADAQSGNLCNMLNHYGSNGSHWYQTLGSDQYPVVDFRHGIVEWDGEKFFSRSRDNLEITYSTSDNEPITLHGGFGASDFMGNYVAHNNEAKFGLIVCDQPITMIDAYTFSENATLQAITLPNSLYRIGNNAFAGCSSLAEITLGENVDFIGDEAFMGCSALKNVYLYAVQPPQCGSDVFDAGIAIHVIDASLYKDAEGWQSLNIVGDADMMTAYKTKKKNELVQASGASTESDIPAEIRDKYKEYAKSIDEATTVAAIEAICVPAAAELREMAQLLSWKDNGGTMINY